VRSKFWRKEQVGVASGYGGSGRDQPTDQAPRHPGATARRLRDFARHGPGAFAARGGRGPGRLACGDQARSDRIKVRTGVTGGKVWALLADPIPEVQRDEDLRHFRLYHSHLEPQAKALGHDMRVVLRDGEEALLICQRCGARGYADATADPLIGGPLFEDDCPEGDLPDED
jgi:hypothetical protein